ncbi:hypothetical protein GCM10023353_29410 [Tomitella cavernea]|uniref:Uncharacterized protein n=1 Tax=Tomitella cavernea TaxID=1387982 RepID=A0ABP9D0E9_9ACTN|nr:transposase [Tomitella cavernea]
MQPEIRHSYWAIIDTNGLDVSPGPSLVEAVDQRITAFRAEYRDVYPTVMLILDTDRAGLRVCLQCSREHHVRITHSNFIERAFGETNRRTKVIGRFPGETSAVSLVWAVLDRASAGWPGVAMTPAGTRLLHDLRRSLLEPPRELRSAVGLGDADVRERAPASA